MFKVSIVGNHAIDKPDEVPDYIVHIDAGKEELIKNRGTKVLCLKILFHSYQASNKTMQEGILKPNCKNPAAQNSITLPRKDVP